MALELFRFTANWVSDTVNGVLATVLIPRHTRATLRYCKALNVIAVPTSVGATEYMALVRATTVLAEIPVVTDVQLTQFLKPILADMKVLLAAGTPAAVFQPILQLSVERTFGPSLSDLEQRVLGVAFKNSGPMSNSRQGWSIVRSSGDPTVTALGLTIMEILIEWPKNTSMFFSREHVANEENQ